MKKAFMSLLLIINTIFIYVLIDDAIGAYRNPNFYPGIYQDGFSLHEYLIRNVLVIFYLLLAFPLVLLKYPGRQKWLLIYLIPFILEAIAGAIQYFVIGL